MCIVFSRREALTATTSTHQISVVKLMIFEFHGSPLVTVKDIMACCTTVGVHTEPLIPMSTFLAMLARIRVICADCVWWRCRDTFLAFHQVITTGVASRPLPLLHVIIKIVGGQNAKGPRTVHVDRFTFEIASRASMLQLQRILCIVLVFRSFRILKRFSVPFCLCGCCCEFAAQFPQQSLCTFRITVREQIR